MSEAHSGSKWLGGLPFSYGYMATSNKQQSTSIQANSMPENTTNSTQTSHRLPVLKGVLN